LNNLDNAAGGQRKVAKKIVNQIGESDMFSRKSLPVGALFMVLVIMLALLGVGYALWSDWLFIDGTVETGTVDAELSFHDNIQENDHGKDVGTCSASLSDQNQDGEDELHISVTNGYPSYECWVEFDVHSVGSVPIHIYQPEIVDAPPVEEVTVGIDGCYGDDHQLHFGEEAFCTIYIHVEQGAIQNHTYTFSAEVETRQFNEPRPSDVIKVSTADFNFYGPFSSTGWGGMSCPAGMIAVGGGYEQKEGNTGDGLIAVEGLAVPGSTVGGSTYPVFPHYTFTPPEQGWVVQNNNDSGGDYLAVYALCAPAP
jgi:hypothetical protein